MEGDRDNTATAKAGVENLKGLTAREAADFLGVSRWCLYALVKSGDVRGYRLGKNGELRFYERDLLAALRPTDRRASA